MDVAPYIQTYTYLGIFILTLLGNFGLPVPEEFIFISAGYFATKEIVNVWVVLLVSIFSILITNNITFFLGRYFGKPLFAKLKKRKRVGYVLKKSEKFFKKHGEKTIFLSRFIWNVRNYTPPLAGASGMRWRRFQKYDFFATCIYTPILVFLGFFFSKFLNVVVGKVEEIKLAIFVLFLIFVSFFISRKIYLKISKNNKNN